MEYYRLKGFQRILAVVLMVLICFDSCILKGYSMVNAFTWHLKYGFRLGPTHSPQKKARKIETERRTPMFSIFDGQFIWG
jgi:hypothetical protein